MYLDFLTSEEFDSLKRIQNIESISYSTFLRGALMCPCIKPPKLRFCVDELETEVNELLNALHIRRKTIKGECLCAFCTEEKDKEEAKPRGN